MRLMLANEALHPPHARRVGPPNMGAVPVVLWQGYRAPEPVVRVPLVLRALAAGVVLAFFALGVVVFVLLVGAM